MAAEVLTLHIDGMSEDGETLLDGMSEGGETRPRPSTIDDVVTDPDMKGVVAFLVSVDGEP